MPSTKNDALSAIIEKAKNDAKFFHNLVFNPEEALKGVELDRRTKGAIVSANPDDLIRIIVSGTVSWCDVTCTSSCGVTCSGDSCGHTTNIVDFKSRYFSRVGGGLNYCDVTCTSSCGGTCNESCGYTTNLTDLGRGERFIR